MRICQVKNTKYNKKYTISIILLVYTIRIILIVYILIVNTIRIIL